LEMKLTLGISVAMVLALPLLAAELPQHLSGPVLVIDGDGLTLGEAEIRLFGIDAPEARGGAGGLRSRTALQVYDLQHLSAPDDPAPGRPGRDHRIEKHARDAHPLLPLVGEPTA
jgi:hypothetical protein